MNTTVLKQKAPRVFVFCLFLCIAVVYLLHERDRIKYEYEKSKTKGFKENDLGHAEKSAVNATQKPEEPHGEKNLTEPKPEDHKMAVSEMPQHTKSQIGVTSNPKRTTKDPQRIVHLDLKGAAPKVKYLEQIFPVFSSLGASAVLMEYEDMFPYNESLSLLRSSFAYSVEDIMEIKRLATISKLEIIPLVQTFGHLEFVLKHEKYFELREVPEFPNSLNPRVPGSLALLKDMLAQVMKLHPEAQHFHIGCDEVYGLGQGRSSENVEQLYLSHVTAVGKFMTETWPSVKLLMWEDMLRKISVDKLKESGLPKLAFPVLWAYSPELNTNEISGWISTYEKAGFKHVWFASAFKGSERPDQMWTPLETRLHNHLSWLKIISSMGVYPNITLEGIILTGWQKFDHFMSLCELLPVGIPSLAVCLQTLKHGSYNEAAKAEINHILGCEIILNRNLCYGSATFAGERFYHLVHHIYLDFKSSVDNILEDRVLKGTFSHYQRKYSFGNPLYLGRFQHQLTKVLNEWEAEIRNLQTQMEAIYFPDTIEEWLEENVNQRMDMLRQMVQDVNRITQRKGRPKSQKA